MVPIISILITTATIRGAKVHGRNDNDQIGYTPDNQLCMRGAGEIPASAMDASAMSLSLEKSPCAFGSKRDDTQTL